MKKGTQLGVPFLFKTFLSTNKSLGLNLRYNCSDVWLEVLKHGFSKFFTGKLLKSLKIFIK
jgi:hypothetical protein